MRFANIVGRAPGRLLASLVVLGCALAVAVAVSVAALATDPEPAQSAGGSTVGIYVESTPSKEDVESGKFQGNGSNLGILVDSDEADDSVVEFWSQGVKLREESIAYGGLVAEPAAPDWSWDAYENYKVGVPADLDPDTDPAPLFAGWCTEEEGELLYDFGTPVVHALKLYAGWDFGPTVKVTLDALGGTLDDPDGGAGASTLELERYVNSTYRALPEPSFAGHTFLGWRTKNGSASGDWGVAVGPGTRVRDVSQIDHTLYAQWRANEYWVRYVNNTDGAGGGATAEVKAVYDGPGQTLWSWDNATDEGFFAPSGKKFAGWNTAADGSGTSYDGGAAFAPPNLTETDGAYVALFVRWADDESGDAGPFDVRYVFNDGATADRVEMVARGECAPEPEMPKRAGWQFDGWYSDLGMTNRWSFDTKVFHALTLRAKWILRLDVTLPVSVGFAVNAETREVTTPEADLYSIKSRTVVPVQVEEMAVISNEDEIETFFDLPEGDSGEEAWRKCLNDTELWVWKTGTGGVSEWTTDFSQAPNGSDSLSFTLPLANEAGERGEYVRVNPDGTLGETVSGWRNFVSLGDNGNFALDRFEGGDDPVELPLKFGMKISDKLRVETALDGPKPITHLIVTVSAQE